MMYFRDNSGRAGCRRSSEGECASFQPRLAPIFAHNSPTDKGSARHRSLASKLTTDHGLTITMNGAHCEQVHIPFPDEGLSLVLYLLVRAICSGPVLVCVRQRNRLSGANLQPRHKADDNPGVHMTASPPCVTPPQLRALGQPLPIFARALGQLKPVNVVTIGSSSTEGDGASSPDLSYPGRLRAALATRFSDRTITIINVGIGGQ